MEALLARSAVSIHVIGAAYGAVPDGPSQKSVVVLQNELASRRCKAGALQRLIWLPDGTRSDQAAQQAFIELLHGDAEAQRGADLITADLEHLKGSMHALLQSLERRRAEAQAPAHAAGTPHVPVCDRRIAPQKALAQGAKEQSVEVAIPAFEGDAAAVREANERLMTTCDAVPVLRAGDGHGNAPSTMTSRNARLPGLEYLPVCTYLASPSTSDKQS